MSPTADPTAGPDGRPPAADPDRRDADAAARDAYSRTVVAVADRLVPSVASIEIAAAGARHRRGAGSAVVLTPDGYLVTAAHVAAGIEEHPDARATATLADGRTFDVELLGLDRLSELAVLRVGADDLTPARLGDADALRVGQLVVAVGNPLGMDGSVSAGVVSALGRSFLAGDGQFRREVDNVIQTDAALHPGSSGGALADSAGRVVGINTALVGPGVGQGLGLAVPIDTAARRIIGALLHEGRVRRAHLGIAGGTRPLPPRAARHLDADAGVEVASVTEPGPAATAGLRPGDIVVAVDGEPTPDVGALQRLMVEDRIDVAVAVTVVRGGEVRDLRIVPEPLPEHD